MPLIDAIRQFFWTHPWWHAAAVIVPPVLVAAFFSWRELRHSADANHFYATSLKTPLQELASYKANAISWNASETV